MSQSKARMSLQEYFQRIGFCNSSYKADLETLKAIHKRHVMSIPFENLSIHCGERNTMDLELIYDKLVRSSRGGWCLENNHLFKWVLGEMGFDITVLGSRVYNSILGDFGPLDSHLIIKVIIDEEPFIADVSFGVSCQIWEPLELISGKGQPQAAGEFRLTERGDTWVLEKSCRKPKVVNAEFAKSSLVNWKESKIIYCFTMEPREVEDFTDACERLQRDPSCLFTNKSICSLQTPTGFRALLGWTYSEVTYEPEEGVDVIDMRDVSDEEIGAVLREQFGVKLLNQLKPVNNKSFYTL